MKTFVFVHVAKTAGTSVIDAISKIVAPGTVRGFYEATPDSLKGLSFVSSHAAFRVLDRLEGDKTFLTAIRGPVERLVSVYRFWQSITDQEAVARGYSHVLKVKDQTFEQFLLSKDEPVSLDQDNEMTRMFCSAHGQLTEADYQQALENMNKCSFIFRTERLDHDMRVFFDHLGCGSRLSKNAANVTDSNHESKPEKYGKAAAVNLSDLSPVGREALAARTSFDQRLYSAALAMAEEKRLTPSKGLEHCPVHRPMIARGEVVMPTPSADFLSMIGPGWAPMEKLLWSVNATAAIRFRVREGTHRRAKARIRLNACILPNRNFMVVDVSADGTSRKSILFVQQDALFNVETLWGRKIDMICSAPHSATIELNLAADRPESDVHTISFETGAAASPELLGWNQDNRPLGVRLESLELV